MPSAVLSAVIAALPALLVPAVFRSRRSRTRAAIGQLANAVADIPAVPAREAVLEVIRDQAEHLDDLSWEARDVRHDVEMPLAYATCFAVALTFQAGLYAVSPSPFNIPFMVVFACLLLGCLWLGGAKLMHRAARRHPLRGGPDEVVNKG